MSGRGLARIQSSRHKAIRSEIRRIGAEIQFHRLTVGLTQEEFAEILGVSVNTITYIETGKRMPSLPMLIQIVRALKVQMVIK